MNVSAVIVTRGNVDLQEIIDSIPQGWEIVIWDNGEKLVSRSDGYSEVATDCSVYGRYAAIEYASHDLIYVQDDDVIVSDPQAIVNAWSVTALAPAPFGRTDLVVCNMPQEFRHDGYVDHALVGFGAAFHRDVPERAFARLAHTRGSLRIGPIDTGLPMPLTQEEREWFHRTCDIPFTYFSPRVIVDVPRTNLEHAYADDRMYRQPEHVGERQRMLDQCRRCNG